MSSLFNLRDRVIVITGAYGTLTASTANYLAAQGAKVVFLGRNQTKLDAALAQCRAQSPEIDCYGVLADVLDQPALEAARDEVLGRYGRIDALVNGAGGNQPGATITPDKTFADLDYPSFRKVIDLNLHGTVLPTLVFAGSLEEAGGAVLNFSSASAPQALTRVVGYSAAKAAVDNFTRWLAVEMGQRCGDKVRVNAIMPGFFIGEQNRRLLTQEDGSLTDRGALICRNTPFGRFGEAGELHGGIHFLLSDASKFVTGIVLAVDGGFTAYSGV